MRGKKTLLIIVGLVMLLADQPSRVLAPPAAKVVAAALQSWNAARKRSNVLAVFDVSGSMKEEVPGTGGQTKMDLLKQAAGRGLGTRCALRLGLLAAQFLSLFVSDVILTPEEVDGLMAGLLVSNEPPRGKNCRPISASAVTEITSRGSQPLRWLATS